MTSAGAQRRVVVTGLGCVTPIGSSVETFRAALYSGTSGIVPLPPYPDAPEAAGPTLGLRFTRAASVPDFDPAVHLETGVLAATDRTTQLAIVAARQAAAESRLAGHYDPGSVAVVLGCSTGGRLTDEAAVRSLYTANARIHPLTVTRIMGSAGASYVSIDLGAAGPVMTLNTACASANHAIGMAFHMVRSGMVEAAVTGGHEAPLTLGFLRAWDSLRVVSPTACRPFSADRDGMTLGEGAAMLTLETLEAATARNAPIYAEIVGFGMSADARHITQPDPAGAAAAIRKALTDGGLAPEEVGYINAHGTGTQANDMVEAAAIHQVFGPRAASIPVTATKSLHGHAIGASGALEALATILALNQPCLPATAGVTAVDPAIDLDVILGQSRHASPEVALSNSLAFGGLNAVLAFRRIH